MKRANDIIQGLQTVNNLDKVFAIPTPALRHLDQQQAAIFVMSRIVRNISKFWKGMEKIISPELSQMAAEMITEDYPGLKLTEIDLIFRNAVMGKYGPTYENLNIERVLGWFHKYWADRAVYAEQKAYQKHLNQKQPNWSSEILKNTPAIQAPTKTFTRIDKRSDEDKQSAHLANIETTRIMNEDRQRIKELEKSINNESSN